MGATPVAFEEVERWVQERAYDMMYTAGVNEQLDYLRWFTRINAEVNPSAPMLIGGSAALSLREKLVERSLAHGLVLGEPEWVLTAVVKALREERSLVDVPGLVVRDRDQIVATGASPLSADLSGLPRAAWELFPVREYLGRRHVRGLRYVTGALPVLVGRGCPYQCIYCLNPESRQVRYRDLEDCIAEVDDLHQRLGLRHIMFRGLTVPADDEASTGLAAGMAERPHLTWEISTRIDLMTAERLQEFKSAGCIFVEYEPEVLDQGDAAEIRRFVDLDRVRQVLSAHRAQGVPFALPRLVCAYAGEVPAVSAEFAQLLHSPACDPTVVRFYPGTDLHQRLTSWRVLDEDSDPEAYLASLLEGTLGPPPLDPLQRTEVERRLAESPRLERQLPRLPNRPRVAVIAAARTAAVVEAIAAAETEYPTGQFLVAASPSTAAQLAWIENEGVRLVDYRQSGTVGLLRAVQATRPHLVIVATDETSGRYSKAKLLAMLSGSRRLAVYDGVTRKHLRFAPELCRDIATRLHLPQRSSPSQGHLSQPTRGEASLLDRPTERMFPEVAPEMGRLLHVARYRFAARFIDSGDRVLDCACGTGYGSALLAQAGACVTGVDRSHTAVRYATYRHGDTGVTFTVADATKLPYPDDFFDVVVSFETIEHIPDDQAFLAEMSRVLKPHGLLIVSTPWQPWSGEIWPYHVREYTRPEYESVLGERFLIRDLVPQLDDQINWRLPLGNFMIALCENASGGALTLRPGRWSRYRPQVSVIMCTWNAMQFLQEALDSVFGQTFQDFEFVVVDNGSRDGTRERLQELHADGKLKLVSLEDNIGVSRGLIVALVHSRGRFIARMDADDLSRPQRLERQIRYLMDHPEVCLLGARAVLIDAEGKDLGRFFGTVHTHEEIVKAMERECPLAHGSIMFRRELLREGGIYDLDYDEAEDYDLYTRVCHQQRMAVLDEVLFEHRQHGAQATKARWRTVEAWAKSVRWAHWFRNVQRARREGAQGDR
ncbi:MAG TPA: glycosyltransferase [Armatimonadota bacterium]|nr:glycosyltransferase [Armatimonadota bacterium]